ncbi:MAG: hypothetical protein DMF64_14225 [Acidobacteria bacterium]|nr:MAG: hypothetical protein DMF64_14225 [Acidobacteriota bacterium]
MPPIAATARATICSAFSSLALTAFVLFAWGAGLVAAALVLSVVLGCAAATGDKQKHKTMSSEQRRRARKVEELLTIFV